MVKWATIKLRIFKSHHLVNKHMKRLLQSLSDLAAQGMEGIVLDVRQNPGGYLDAAVDIANLFLEDGQPILQVQGRTGEPEIIKAKGGKKFTQPVTVLIDEGSASASEILAAALNESGGAKIIGVNSFGKGTMQTVSYLNDGSNLKFTTGKWLTPKGNWINEKGINLRLKYNIQVMRHYLMLIHIQN